MTRTIAVVGTGEMGSAVAKSLISEGHLVTTCLADRSARTRKRAEEAGVEDRDSLAALAADADILLSILPPADAPAFAEAACAAIEASGRDVLFTDCNAVSPMTVAGIAATAESHGVRFQDVGIVGAAPKPDRAAVRFYTSGPHDDVIAGVATALIDVRSLGPEIGRASALKMVFASLTKGTFALRAAAMIAGESLGVGDDIRREWRESMPDTWRAMEKRTPELPSVSGRWTGEMREIAQTYESLGLTGSFHEGAEWIYELLSQTALADESREEAREQSRSVEDTLAHFVRALDDRS